jgi:exopolyphosphatase / guanosine-5'-triphosphate,3'-diphosphate pyrophosphatase
VTGGEITRPGLDLLRERLLAAGHVDRHDLPGLSAQRAPVYPGGLAVLTEVFDALEIDRPCFRPRARCARACCGTSSAG